MRRKPARPRKQFRRGVRYAVSGGGLKTNITYWASFRVPTERRKYPEEKFVIFRLEPMRFPRKKK